MIIHLRIENFYIPSPSLPHYKTVFTYTLNSDTAFEDTGERKALLFSSWILSRYFAQDCRDNIREIKVDDCCFERSFNFESHAKIPAFPHLRFQGAFSLTTGARKTIGGFEGRKGTERLHFPKIRPDPYRVVRILTPLLNARPSVFKGAPSSSVNKFSAQLIKCKTILAAVADSRMIV